MSEIRLGDLARRDGRGERLAEEHRRVDLLARLLVEPLLRVIEVVHRAPVGQHPARIIPVALEHLFSSQSLPHA